MQHTPSFPDMAREFPDFDQATLPAIPNNWHDQSWHNDTCPSFGVGDEEQARFRVFIDYADPAQREFPETHRYSVTDEGAAVHPMTQPAVDSDDWSDVLVYVLGQTFADVLAEWLGHDFAKMRLENTGAEYQGPCGACASHNYCDANMAMDEAFQRAMGREPAIEDLPDGSEAPDVALWNAAWAYAKASRLTAGTGA